MYYAWLMAGLSRTKDFPKYERLLERGPDRRQQSPGELRSALELLSRQYGIPLRPLTPVTHKALGYGE